MSKKELPAGEQSAVSLRWDGVAALQSALPRADMRVEGAGRPRGAGGGAIPEDISPGGAETRLTP